MAPSPTRRSTQRLSELARHVVIPEGVVSTGWPRVERRLSEMAIRFDGWQQGMGQLVLGKRDDGKYACTVGGAVMSIPRQVGKTFSVGALIIALCIEFPGLKVLWTAHRVRTITNTFRSMKSLARRRKVLPHIAYGRNAGTGIRDANGEQEIPFRNGSIILFGAREAGFGRGFEEVDVIVMDEAQILSEKALEDMIATTNQCRHPHGALLFYMGTPPRPTDPGEAFWFKRTKALAGTSKDIVYIEFSADEDAKLDDRAQWAKANPSYPHRTPLESMLRLRENLPSDESWRREALGIWDELDVHQVLVPKDVWWARKVRPEDPEETRTVPAVTTPPAAVAVDISPAGVLGISGTWKLAGGRVHGEVLSLGEHSQSTAVAWLKENTRRNGRRIPILIDEASPAAAMVPALKAAKLRVNVTGASDMGRACVGWHSAVIEGLFTYCSPDVGEHQDPLDTAVFGAKKREIKGAGAWGLDRKDDTVDLAVLVSLILAHYGAQLAKTRTGNGRTNGNRRGVVM